MSIEQDRNLVEGISNLHVNCVESKQRGMLMFCQLQMKWNKKQNSITLPSYCHQNYRPIKSNLLMCKHFCTKSFWEKLINGFLWPTTRTSDILNAFTYLNFSRIRLQPVFTHISGDAVLYIALSELWKAHWRCVFNNKPFTSTDLVLNSTRYSVTRWSQEEELPRRF